MNGTSFHIVTKYKMELKELMEERDSLVGQLNILQEKHTQNEYDDDIISKMMETKERINKVKKKIDVLRFKDNKRE